MKLIDLVRHIEATGLEPVLSTHKEGLHLSGWTIADSRGDSRSLFGCALAADSNNEPVVPWDNAFITEQLAKAAKHPDAIARREWMENYEKELAAEMERARNAAA